MEPLHLTAEWDCASNTITSVSPHTDECELHILPPHTHTLKPIETHRTHTVCPWHVLKCIIVHA